MFVGVIVVEEVFVIFGFGLYFFDVVSICDLFVVSDVVMVIVVIVMVIFYFMDFIVVVFDLCL